MAAASSNSNSPDAGGGQVAVHWNHWIVALTVTMATFMEVLDTSIANVALPHIAGNLSATVSQGTWVLTSYLISNAIVLPLSGWLSSVFGRKRFYMSCVLIFTVSSALSGMAPSLGWLIFFRVLQGVGGGGLQPSEQAILIDSFPPAKRGMAMAVYGVAILVAPILGPTLGGWITDSYSWRWIFYINVPVGIVSLFMSHLVVQDPPHLRAPPGAWRGRLLRIDYIGLGLIALGLGALQIMLDRGQEDDWFGSSFIVMLAVLAVVGLVGAVWWEWRHPEPIINLRLFKERNFRFASIVLFCSFAILFASTVLLPQLAQTLMGYSATMAGLIVSPSGIFAMLVMPLVGWLLGRQCDARWMIIFGLILVSAGAYWMSQMNLLVSPWQLIWPRIVQVVGIGFLWVPINTSAYLYLPKEETSNASGMFNLLRNMGASLGISISATLLARRAQFHQSRLVEQINPLNPLATQAVENLTQAYEHSGASPHAAQQQAWGAIYQLVQQQALALSYFDLFWLFSVASLAIIPLVLLMRKSVAPPEGVAAP